MHFEKHQLITLALANLGLGSIPTVEVLRSCENYICQLFCTEYKDAKSLRWHLFKHLKPHQSVENLPSTPGAIEKHVFRAHLQCHVWQQVLVVKPTLLDAKDLEWIQSNGELQMVLTSVAIAPDALIQLVICQCDKSLCTGRCKCRKNN